MKAVVILLLAISAFQIGSATHDPDWSIVKPKNAGARFIGGHATAAVGQEIFVFNGFYEYFGDQNENNTCQSTAYNYFYSTNWAFRVTDKKWRHIASHPSPKAFGAAVADEGSKKIYYQGGAEYNAAFSQVTLYDNFAAYDVECDSWSDIPATGGPGNRAYHGMVKIGNDIFVFGGVNSYYFLASNDLYAFNTVSQTWRSITPNSVLPHERDGFIMAAMKIGDTPVIVVIGGEYLTYTTGYVTLNDAWYFNVTSEEWIQFDAPDTPYISNVRSYGVLDNKLIVYGGEGTGSVCPECCSPFAQDPTNLTRRFDPETGTWEILDVDAPSDNLKRASGDVVRGKFYVSLGWIWDGVDADPAFNAQDWNNNFYVFDQ